MALQAIEIGEAAGAQPIHLPVDQAVALDPHRERTEIVEQRTGQLPLPLKAGPGQPGMVHLAAAEGAVDEHQVALHRQPTNPAADNGAVCPTPMTIALLIALAASLALMAVIVKRLEKAS